MAVYQVPNGLANLLPPAVVTPDLTATLGNPNPADQNQPYPGFTWTAQGGTPPYTWTATSVATGMTVTTVGADGYLSGTPTGSGADAFHLKVTDAALATVEADLTLTINPAVIGGLSRLDPDNSAHLEYLGAFRVKRVAGATTGTTAGTGGACTYRITPGGVFKLMMVLQGGGGGVAFGDLVEWDLPDTGHYKPLDGNYMPATQLIESGRWHFWDKARDTVGWKQAPGTTKIGGICLTPDPADPTNTDLGIIWYTAYGYYTSKNWPVLGATRIRFSDHAVLDKYGPWWYDDNTVGASDKLRWKEVWQGIGVIPEYARVSLNGHKMYMVGMVGSVASAGHIGPGIQTFPDFPSLSDPPNSVLPAGRMIADFTGRGAIAAKLGATDDESTARRGCRRQDRYSNDLLCIMLGGGGDGLDLPDHWKMSLDLTSAVVWAHTAALHGYWIWGSEIGHPDYDPNAVPPGPVAYTRYGDNPAIEDGSIEPLDPAYIGNGNGVGYYEEIPKTVPPVIKSAVGHWIDPTKDIPEHAHGYAGTDFRAALRMMDVQHFFEVAAGSRSAASDGMRPWTQLDWHKKWGIPWSRNGHLPKPDYYGTAFYNYSERAISSNNCQSGVFDPTDRGINDRGRIITVHSASVNPVGGANATWDPLILVHRVKL